MQSSDDVCALDAQESLEPLSECYDCLQILGRSLYEIRLVDVVDVVDHLALGVARALVVKQGWW